MAATLVAGDLSGKSDYRYFSNEKILHDLAVADATDLLGAAMSQCTPEK